MTELRESVRGLVYDAIDERECDRDLDDVLDEATDAIMALFAGGSGMGSFDFLDFLRRKNSWSEDAFGPVEHRGPLGPLDHLLKEVAEAEADPGDVIEFADLVFLATDAAHRAGHTPEALARALEDKLEINRNRDWGDWRTKPADAAIEHNREGEPAGRPAPAPVVVRELEWAYTEKTRNWVSITSIGNWWINEVVTGEREAYGPTGFLDEFKSTEAAKAACQADFARRILSAVNAVSEARVAELEAEVAHLRRVEAGAVRQADELAAMRGVVEAAWRVDACEDPEAEETAHAFDDLRKRLVALDALTKAEG